MEVRLADCQCLKILGWAVLVTQHYSKHDGPFFGRSISNGGDLNGDGLVTLSYQIQEPKTRQLATSY